MTTCVTRPTRRVTNFAPRLAGISIAAMRASRAACYNVVHIIIIYTHNTSESRLCRAQPVVNPMIFPDPHFQILKLVHSVTSKSMRCHALLTSPRKFQTAARGGQGRWLGKASKLVEDPSVTDPRHSRAVSCWPRPQHARPRSWARASPAASPTPPTASTPSSCRAFP